MSNSEYSLSEKQRATLALALSAKHADPAVHLRAEDFAQLVDNRASAAQRAEWTQHLTHCPDCYTLFLDVAQWRLDAQAATDAARIPSAIRTWIHSIKRWPYALGTVASLLLVSVFVYLVPVPQQAPLPVSEHATIAAPERALPASKKPEPRLARSPAVADQISGQAIRKEDLYKPELPTTAEYPEFDRSAPEPIKPPKLGELVTGAMMTPPPFELEHPTQFAAEEENDVLINESLAANEVKSERIEVTGSRIKASDRHSVDSATRQRTNREQEIRHAEAAEEATTGATSPTPPRPFDDYVYGQGFAAGLSPAREHIASETAMSGHIDYQLGLWAGQGKSYCAKNLATQDPDTFARLSQQWPTLRDRVNERFAPVAPWPEALSDKAALCAVMTALPTP